MIVFIYKNGFCDPARNIGVCRQFGTSKDVDDYIKFFVASLDPQYMANYRIFITNDGVEFVEVDHYVLFNEPLHRHLNRNRIQEVSISAIAAEVNEKFAKALQNREKKRQQVASLGMGATVRT